MGMLDGKTAVITGSGRGIGRAAALMIAREGAAVVVSDIDSGPAEETVKEIVAAGGRAVSCVGDVTRPDFPEKLIGTALNTFGSLHIIVNNAGYTWDGMLHKMTDEQWSAMFDVHVTRRPSASCAPPRPTSGKRPGRRAPKGSASCARL